MVKKFGAVAHRRLMVWYDEHARDLPWRRTTDPYRIWISEVMLQQTTVVAVIPYFERFLARFPTVRDLADAEESEVLRYWEGLGYYSRGRNLRRAAQVIVSDYGGSFPSKVDELRSLPGIGRYTAGAIASFAFDQSAPIVEANTLRLFCRLIGMTEDPRSSRGQEILWAFAEAVLPRTSPGRFNQALMELGATVCSPRTPDCPNCPLAANCRAFADGSQDIIPRASVRPKITAVDEVSVSVRRKQKYLVRRRSPGERWAGLWDFIRFPAEPDASPLAIASEVFSQTGLRVRVEKKFAEIKHTVTRYRITLSCMTALVTSGELTEGSEWKWVSSTEFVDIPLSVTGRRIAKLLSGHS